MKIIFLNTWEATQKEDMRQFLIEHAPSTDVFCFQEHIYAMPELCKEILSDFNSVHDEKFIRPKENYQLATYVKNTIDIISSEILLKDDPIIGFGIFTEIIWDGHPLSILNVHGIAYPGEKLDTPDRIRQSERLIDFMNKKEGLKIVGGDFNLLPATESVKLFEKNGYKNLISDFKVDTTRNRLGWERFPDTIQMYADFVFVAPELKVQKFEVPKNEISDHLPLILEIED